MRLEFPDKKHKLQYKELIREWKKIESIPTSPSALFNGDNFEDFLEITKKDIKGRKLFIPAHLFFLCDDEQIFGAIQIRHSINHPNLIEKGGHIGYGISPKFRKKGHGTEILRLGLIKAKRFGIKKVLITCDVENIGSNKIIKKNGGIFERKTEYGKLNRYWIEL